MIKVLLVDDQKILAEGMKSVLETCSDFTVCGIAGDGVEAVALAEKLKPDVVLMDIRMPNMNGVVATKRIKEIDENIKIIILTTFDDSDYILSAINNGASGYLLKDIGSTALIDAIKNAYAGDTILPSKIAKKITDAAMMVSSDKEIKLKKLFNLSDREVEIALMLNDGFSNRQIAAAMKLSDGTARNYISSIYSKLGVDGRAAAVIKLKEKM
ncbi:MAG: response regulator transcription factor [Clostridia bacterium]|nr:response regulator transcription factor [Clostridia bacterium]